MTGIKFQIPVHSVTDLPFKSIKNLLVGIETMLIISKPSSLLGAE